MKHVTGIGGIFFKANDPEKLTEWYRKHLGLEVEAFGGVVFRDNEASAGGPQRQAHTVWSPFPADSDYFAPSEKPFMINFRVIDLDALLAQLRRDGVEVDERTDKSEFGYFGWAMDPEGNRIELWQPPEVQSASP
ncbi:MAG TPA: VOC family protein [Chthoniobacterales bacterium]|nr:VOC family protein [Chthoniobacterales bacterium]